MKKNLGLSCSLLFLLLGLCAVLVMAGSAPDLSVWGVVSTVLLCLLIAACGGLDIYGFGHERLGRLNLDIFTTLCQFGVFMFSFALPRSLVVAFGENASGLARFGPLRTVVARLCAGGIGLYEIFLFAAVISVGLTIGERSKA